MSDAAQVSGGYISGVLPKEDIGTKREKNFSLENPSYEIVEDVLILKMPKIPIAPQTNFNSLKKNNIDNKISITEYEDYIKTALNIIEENNDVLGYVVDLSETSGYDSYPLTLALSPILEDGILMQHINKNNELIQTDILQKGVLKYEGRGEEESEAINLFKNDLKINKPLCVIINKTTLGSGEYIALVFRENRGARLFGESTGGHAVGIHFSSVSDTVAMILAQSKFKPANSTEEFGDIMVKPDVVCKENEAKDKAIEYILSEAN